MKKTINEQSHPDAGSMLSQKTNEDFNKKQPNLNDPNEKKNSPKADAAPKGTNGKKLLKKK